MTQLMERRIRVCPSWALLGINLMRVSQKWGKSWRRSSSMTITPPHMKIRLDRTSPRPIVKHSIYKRLGRSKTEIVTITWRNLPVALSISMDRATRKLGPLRILQPAIKGPSMDMRIRVQMWSLEWRQPNLRTSSDRPTSPTPEMRWTIQSSPYRFME